MSGVPGSVFTFLRKRMPHANKKRRTMRSGRVLQLRMCDMQRCRCSGVSTSMLSGNIWAILLRLFCYATLVECFSVTLSVGCMLLVSGSKIVCTRKILFGAHIYVIVVCIIEHRLYGIKRWYAYRTYGKTCITIGVVWTIYTQMIYHDTAQCKVV